MNIPRKEYEKLQRRLSEAEETLQAIRSGQVDAILISGPDGDKVYSITSAEFPYRHLIEEMHEGVATLSPQGIILYCNRSFARLIQTPLERAIGDDFFCYLHPSYKKAFAASVVSSSSDNTIAGEYVLITQSGSWVQVLISFTRQEHIGQSTSIIVTDLSERKQAEEALRRAHEGLEEKVRERTKELAEEIAIRERAENEVRLLNASLEVRVRERTAEIEAAHRELQAFSYTISHDLRAPLRAVRCYTAILRESTEEKLSGEERDHLKTINESAIELSTMIERLLDFSRLSRSGVRKYCFDMEELVASTLDALRADGFDAPHLAINRLLPAFGDRSLLGIVLRNLIANAVKFSRHNPDPHIEIGCLPHFEGTEYYIRDNGVGFDMAYADKLFEVFQKLHSKEEFEGIGVGLAIARRIIERHGGRIWAESEPGKGATFHFILPHETPSMSDNSILGPDTLPEYEKRIGK